MCLLENLTGVCSGDHVNDSDCKQTVANISCKHGEVYIALNDEIKTYCDTLAWMWINPPYHKNPMYCQLSCSQWRQGMCRAVTIALHRYWPIKAPYRYTMLTILN